jgi:NhaP-type Na+/H+ or K+/H+ antiporter
VGVLQRKRVDPHLFSLVFGESALNDAVALVLFKTLADFLRQNAMQNYDNDNNNDLYKNVGKYLLDLLVQCVVSPILGLVFASLMGLAFKHGRMRDHKLLELSLYIMPVYIPFMLSELLELSGMYLLRTRTERLWNAQGTFFVAVRIMGIRRCFVRKSYRCVSIKFPVQSEFDETNR